MSVEVVSDLLDCKADMLVHQTNATSTRAKGLSSALFSRFPYSDVYSGRTYGRVAKLGEIVVKYPPPNQPGAIVAACMAQKFPGGPYRMSDGVQQRTQWFGECLRKLASHPVAQDPNKVVAFPYKIGCGLAKGKWIAYKGMIDDFARQVKANVIVCRLPTVSS